MEVIVVGYPKSGNTWLSRLLGDVLDSPVEGWRGVKPLAVEGGKRRGGYVVRQLHAAVSLAECDGVLGNGWLFHVRCWDRGKVKVVHIVRDPRDVAVSCMYYWDMADVSTAIRAMGERIWPLARGPWQAMVGDWLKVEDAILVRYERLHEDTVGEVDRVLAELGLESSRVVAAVKRQSFDEKRARIERDGDDRPYGKTIQLKNLRRGMPGDWRNHFTVEDSMLAERYFGTVARALGYEM